MISHDLKITRVVTKNLRDLALFMTHELLKFIILGSPQEIHSLSVTDRSAMVSWKYNHIVRIM